MTEDLGLSLEKSEASVLGQCKNVIITKEDTIIMDGLGTKV